MRGNQSLHNGNNIASGERVRLQPVRWNIKAGFLRHNARLHDHGGIDAARGICTRSRCGGKCAFVLRTQGQAEIDLRRG